MNKNMKRLPDSELEVMQVIWELEAPVPRKAVEERMKDIHPIAQTTLLTLITRLASKNFIEVTKVGRNSSYTPLISQHDYLASQSKRFVDKLCGGSISAFASALNDSGLSREDIEELRELLNSGEL